MLKSTYMFWFGIFVVVVDSDFFFIFPTHASIPDPNQFSNSLEFGILETFTFDDVNIYIWHDLCCQLFEELRTV